MPSSVPDILKAINDGASPINVNGLCGSASAYLASKIRLACPKQTILIVTASADQSNNMLEDLKVFWQPENLSHLALFPAPDVMPYTQLSPEPRLWADRIQILFRLAHGEQLIIVAPVTACLRRLPPKLFVANSARVLRIGSQIDRDDFTSWLTEMGYADTGLVEDEGEFAVRGFIIDLWSPSLDDPVRIEFDGDKMVSMRQFDPATQRSKGGEVTEITIIPVSDVPFTREGSRLASNSIMRLADEGDFPTGERRHLIEMINERVTFAGIESFMPLFHGTTASILDYMPQQTLVIYDDPQAIAQTANSYAGAITDIASHTTSPERLIPPDRLIIPQNEWNEQSAQFQQMLWNVLTLSSPPSPSPIEGEGKYVSSYSPIKGEGVSAGAGASFTVDTFSNTDIRPAIEGHIKDENPLLPVINLLHERQEMGENIILTCHTKVQAERLSDLFRWHGLSLMKFDGPFEILKTLPSTAFRLMMARLSAGFNWPNEHLSIITDEEIFGSKVIRKPKARPPIEHFTTFSELVEGDYLVHEQHGIGKYRGLKNLSIQGTNNDFLLLEYLGGDKLYLPVYRLNLLERYVGPGDEPPFLDRLGGTRWDKAQKKARKDILTIAKELLRIYAQREIYPGFPFPQADTNYEEFSAAFPYDETPDQERAIDDVIRDMEIERPMDRLICGDVGYGKTEVAMRAAFKAAMAGKQSAVLVPTTLLALQHFENFSRRFANSAVRIEMLSRFRTPKDQTLIIGELARGTIDIIIGTHRLLQKDVAFRDLGLLVIDEEQRFGVSHKEKIRRLRATVDCLTLTATPIPRTLHMSLTGMRDISVIDTPPMDRLSILTHIVPFDDGVIRHAILEEITRGGQIFFVHNRVETILSMKEHLSKLVPEASIAVAHGQMKEHDLEDVMHRFLTRVHNVLLTTSIIESGLDIPSANTIIVNRADTFGLAQLYQIRGRVGRSNVRAYAYLLIPEDGVISPIAKKRLTVLQRFTELGSGFQIAMHDLEIRGSGNILGRAQSGHVAAIGYEMYTKLLSREIKRLQGKAIEEEIDPELQLPISAFLPETYVTDAGTRIDIYRRLASRETLPEVSDMQREIEDRFGPLPSEAQNLMGIMEIKVMAKILKVRQLSFDGRTFACRLDPTNKVDLQRLTQLVDKNKQYFRLRPPDRILYIMGGSEAPRDIIENAKFFLSELESCVSEPINANRQLPIADRS